MQGANELVPVARKSGRLDSDHAVKAADARAVRVEQFGDEALGSLSLEVEVLPHARAAVEQEDDRDGLDRILKLRDGLSHAVVEDLEVALGQVGNQSTRRIENRGIHGDGVDPRAELR